MLCSNKHECDNLKYDNNHNLRTLIGIFKKIGDDDWCLVAVPKDVDSSNEYSLIGGLKYCPFCGKKLK